MRVSKKVQKVLDFSFEHNLELVSYGIAPNPNGFCYEVHPGLIDDSTGIQEPEASLDIQLAFNKLLDSLSKEEV